MMETTETTAPETAPPATEAEAAPAPKTEPTVSASLFQQTEAERNQAQARIAELEAALATVTSERDEAVVGRRREKIRRLSGIDDDEVADKAHKQYTSAVADAEEGKRPDFKTWWDGLRSNEEARNAQPKILRAYLTPSDPKPAKPRRADAPRFPASRTQPAHGKDQRLSAEDIRRLPPQELTGLAISFFGGKRRI